MDIRTLQNRKPTITLETWSANKSTVGRLSLGDFICTTLELPWKANKRFISCIPAGTYEIFMRNSPKNGLVLQLKNVPSRSFIQVHAGNFTSQIEGCILTGESIVNMDGDGIPDVSNSRNTLTDLLYEFSKLSDEIKDKATIKVIRN